MQIGSATLRASPAPVSSSPSRLDDSARSSVVSEQSQRSPSATSATELQLRAALAASPPTDNPADAQQEREQRAKLAELEGRQRDVRATELAQAALAGRYAGSPVYSYARGPDGQAYAVSGDVPIDVSPIPNDPEATLRKMQVVMQAAMASGDASAQDVRVAAQARAIAAQARAELADEKRQAEAQAVDERQKSDKKPEAEDKPVEPQQNPAIASSLELYRVLDTMQSVRSAVSVRV